MSTKLTFARNAAGEFNFSEPRLAKLNAALRERAIEPKIPRSLMFAASRLLITEAHRAADTRGVPYAVAMARVVAERPELLALTRGQQVADADPAADVELDAP